LKKKMKKIDKEMNDKFLQTSCKLNIDKLVWSEFHRENQDKISNLVELVKFVKQKNKWKEKLGN
jgi:hypothetical protein